MQYPLHYEDVPDFDPDTIRTLWVDSFPVGQPPDETYTTAIVAGLTDPAENAPGPVAGDLLLCWLRGYQPMRYATAVLTVWARARHEQSVWTQLHATGMNLDTAQFVVARCRKAWEPLNPAHTAPMSFEPILSSSTMQGMVNVSVCGREIGTWTLDDTLGHATAVLQNNAMAPLDQAFFEALTRHEDVEPRDDPEFLQVARAAVSQLSDYMQRADGAPPVDAWPRSKPGRPGTTAAG